MPWKESGNQNYQLARLQPYHYEILRLAAAGIQPQAIAHVVNRTPQTIYNVINSDEGKKELARLGADRDGVVEGVMQRIRDMSAPSLQRILDIVEDPEASEIPLSERKFVVGVYQDLLDRAGVGKTSKVEHNVNRRLSSNELQDIKNRAKELRQNMDGSFGAAEDIEYTPIYNKEGAHDERENHTGEHVAEVDSTDQQLPNSAEEERKEPEHSSDSSGLLNFLCSADPSTSSEDSGLAGGSGDDGDRLAV